MTKTLTEQWQNGTLPDGVYYILVDKYEQNEPEIDIGVCCNSNFEWWIVKEVLAPVPSYDEYQRLVSNSDESVQKMYILEKKLEIATKALEKYQEAINRFKKDPMNNIIMLAHQLIYDIDTDSKKALKEMEGVK